MISREDDDAHAVVAVKEIVSSNNFLPEWGRKRVAPIEKVQFAVGGEEEASVAYCFARSSFKMATGPSRETTIFFHSCAL